MKFDPEEDCEKTPITDAAVEQSCFFDPSGARVRELIDAEVARTLERRLNRLLNFQTVTQLQDYALEKAQVQQELQEAFDKIARPVQGPA